MPETYHLRRIERDMPDRADQLAVLRTQKYLSLALARDNQPYLVSLNYGFSEAENCFYVHSAPEGRKLDYLRANPRVWGQVIEDRGYLVGQCSHSYRSVMFEARAELEALKMPMERRSHLFLAHRPAYNLVGLLGLSTTRVRRCLARNPGNTLSEWVRAGQFMGGL
jgi:nitroimidazol reductase NimA-like FMN-containing flavoprotein (pyridoxamine 5'-phosphate oxidase superfamily)